MIIQPAQRTESIKEYYFSRKNKELAELNADRSAKGLDPIVNLGIGAPDGCPPASAVEALCENARRPDTHRYQPYTGTLRLREAFAAWYRRYYGVSFDPRCEIQPLMGSKEGILLICMTFVNPGDKVLIPNPGYPTYTSATHLCGGVPVPYRLKEEDGWMPDFEALESMDLSGVKLMWINYPNMPTGAPADMALYRKVVQFARRHGILVVNDNPYSFILTSEQTSIFGIEGARECCLELNSLSKAHNMSGWRIGMVAGEAEYIREILKVKSQMDSGMFLPMQEAAIAALGEGPEWFEALNAGYVARRQKVFELFDLLGLEYRTDSCGLFVLGKVKEGHALCRVPDAKKDDTAYCDTFASRPVSEQLSEKVLHDAGVFLTPGYIFGSATASFVRASLCATVPVLEKAIERVREIL